MQDFPCQARRVTGTGFWPMLPTHVRAALRLAASRANESVLRLERRHWKAIR